MIVRHIACMRVPSFPSRCGFRLPARVRGGRLLARTYLNALREFKVSVRTVVGYCHASSMVLGEDSGGALTPAWCCRDSTGGSAISPGLRAAIASKLRGEVRRGHGRRG